MDTIVIIAITTTTALFTTILWAGVGYWMGFYKEEHEETPKEE